MLLGKLLYNDDEWFNLKLDLHLEVVKGQKHLYAKKADGSFFFRFSDDVTNDYPVKETYIPIKMFQEEKEFIEQVKDQGFLTGKTDLVKNKEGILIMSYEFKGLIKYADIKIDDRFRLRVFNTDTYSNELLMDGKSISLNVPFVGYGNEFVLPVEKELELERMGIILPFERTKKFAYKDGSYYPIMRAFVLKETLSFATVPEALHRYLFETP